MPAALTDVDWEDWLAATRLAVREARRRIGPTLPLHLVGFSNGGALAMQVRAGRDRGSSAVPPGPAGADLADDRRHPFRALRRPGRRCRPSCPAFAKAAWLAILPEFNPFKYNSFPVNGARQSYRLTDALQAQIQAGRARMRLATLPPMLTFQSVIDFTVSTRAIISALYAHLPANGSELVLFDVNRTVKFGPLLRTAVRDHADRLLPRRPAPIGRRSSPMPATAPARWSSGSPRPAPPTSRMRDLGLTYPRDVFSLSHVALPFPGHRSALRHEPDPAEPDFGINLGTVAARGERGALIVSLDSLLRMSSNPFFPYLLERVNDGIAVAGPPR